jgi:hypothetical protein
MELLWQIITTAFSILVYLKLWINAVIELTAIADAVFNTNYKTKLKDELKKCNDKISRYFTPHRSDDRAPKKRLGRNRNN